MGMSTVSHTLVPTFSDSSASRTWLTSHSHKLPIDIHILATPWLSSFIISFRCKLD